MPLSGLCASAVLIPTLANGVTVDAAGNVYTVGDFSLTVDFDPGPETFNLTSAGNGDVFVSKLDKPRELRVGCSAGRQ